MLLKDRPLLLLKALQEGSDDEKWMTTAELRNLLEAEGQECTVRTLRRDIRTLIDCGYDIGIREGSGVSTEYALRDRKWDVPELQLLVDAVSAAQFIPEARSRELIGKLASMAGPSHREELRPQILVSEHVKAKNKDMIYTVQAIRQAMDKDKKISFRYLRYTPDRQQVPKHAGTAEEKYVVSPYATVWNNDRYYLVGFSDKRRKVISYRIDRMKVPVLLRQKRVSPPEDFDIRDYTDKVFWMYDGLHEEVTLRCRMSILDQVIDRFGEKVNLKVLDSGTFDVKVPVAVSSTFYGWMCQFTGEMRIISPQHVREAYASWLQEAIDDVLG